MLKNRFERFFIPCAVSTVQEQAVWYHGTVRAYLRTIKMQPHIELNAGLFLDFLLLLRHNFPDVC